MKITKRNLVEGVAAVLVSATLCILMPSSIAATQAKLAISVTVATTCRVVVSMLNGTPSVTNICGKISNSQADGRAFVSITDDQARIVTVSY
jgi:hypothetical protein